MDKKKAKPTNGQAMLAPNLQTVRESVMVDELKARHWRAQYETAYFHLEFEKILPEYEALLKRKEAEREEFIKKQQEFVDQANKVAGEQGLQINEDTPQVSGNLIISPDEAKNLK